MKMLSYGLMSLGSNMCLVGSLSEYGRINPKKIAAHSMIAPNRCCLKEISDISMEIKDPEEKIVEKAFLFLGLLSAKLKNGLLSD